MVNFSYSFPESDKILGSDDNVTLGQLLAFWISDLNTLKFEFLL